MAHFGRGKPAPVCAIGAASHCRKIATRAEEKAFNLRSLER
jgi:hypothetical protein